MRWRSDNPERSRETARAWREVNRDKSNGYTQKWRAANQEESNARAREYRAANPEKVRALNHRPGAAEQRRVATAKWRLENLERARKDHAERQSRRRAAMRGSETEPVDRDAIIARDRSTCHLCGDRVARSELTLDHLIPVALGGPHTAANLAVAHRSCNARKWINPANEQLRLVG